jgi:NADH-quinone oxidoreductase subunit J
MSAIVFIPLLFLTALAATMVILARNPVHAVLFLILSFFSTAGLFLMLGAEFMAMTLVIVYVGAVAVLFLFVVMMLRVTPDQNLSLLEEKGVVQALKDFGQIGIFLSIFIVFAAFLISVPVLADLSAHHDLTVLLAVDSFLKAYQESLWVPFHQGIDFYSLCVSTISLAVAYQLAFTVTHRSWHIQAARLLKGNAMAFISGAGMVGALTYLGWTWTLSPYAREMVQEPVAPDTLMPNTHAIGHILYTDYVLGVQMAGFILLLAMVGAISLTHRKREGVKRQSIAHQLARNPSDTLVLTDPPIRGGL